MNNKTLLFVLALLLTFSVTKVEAHRDGCHAAHSCPSDTGSYVCGDLGNSSECGSAPQPTTAPVAPTSAPIKQFVAPVATSVPTRIPTRIPTIEPTLTPTVEPTTPPTAIPVKKIQSTPSIAVAGETGSGSGAGGLVTMGIMGALGYFGYKKFKKKKPLA
jgi:hypothetical protein